jgi:hypothetical protein
LRQDQKQVAELDAKVAQFLTAIGSLTPAKLSEKRKPSLATAKLSR